MHGDFFSHWAVLGEEPPITPLDEGKKVAKQFDIRPVLCGNCYLNCRVYFNLGKILVKEEQ